MPAVEIRGEQEAELSSVLVPRTVAIITNNTNCERHVQYYSTLEKYFMANNWIISDTFDVDMVVISGCGFHNMMLEKVKKLLGDLDEANFAGELVMTGCIPTTHAAEWKKGFRGTLVQLSGEASLDEIIKAQVPFKKLQPVNILKPHHDTIVREEDRILHVKVADGCIRKCTFCVIHKAKGKIRSIPAADLYRQIDAGVAAGYKTIFLMGEDTFAYGTDVGTTIIEFVEEIAARHPQLKFQFGNLDHRWLVEYTDAIISMCNRGLVQQLHVGMQHNNDELLVRMGRGGIPFSRIYEAVVRLKQACPELYLGVDIIVGFPGETEAMFNDLQAFFKDEPYIDNVQHNGYSAISGAPAAEFEAQVQPAEIAARWYRLTRTLKKRTAFNRESRNSNFDLTFRETRDIDYLFVKNSVVELPSIEPGALKQ
ncbi:radical SAM protein [Bradyrhizobium prioriisuperbiae]|uniref:radical SAM protein n=1 Tax=Bradyrhizobium prioriisuperbiae TaxID=2854389 RepID=UPI0028E36BA2|nr:radical SAM protein [Bradyrhizobium prioritasuperba]